MGLVAASGDGMNALSQQCGRPRMGGDTRLRQQGMDASPVKKALQPWPA